MFPSVDGEDYRVDMKKCCRPDENTWVEWPSQDKNDRIRNEDFKGKICQYFESSKAFPPIAKALILN